MADEKLKIIIDAQDNASDDLKKLQGNLSGVEAQAEKSGGKLGGMSDLITGKLVPALTIAGAVALAKGIGDQLDYADSLQDTTQALEAYTGSSAAADAVTEQIAEGVNHVITEHEAAADAVKLYGAGLVDNAADAATATEAAIVLGDAVGMDATESFDKLFTTLQTGSTRSLKDFGLNVEKVKKRIDELKLANKGLSDEEATSIAVMEEMDGKMKQLEEAGYEVGTSYEQLKTRFQEIKDGFALFVSDVAMPVLDAQRELEESSNANAEAAARSSETWEEYLGKLDIVTRSIPTVAKEIWNTVSAQKALDEAIAMGGGRDGWISDFQTIETAAGNAAGQMEQVKLQILGLTEAEIGRVALQDLNRELDEAQAAGGSLPGYEEAARDIMDTFLEIPDSEQDAFFAVAELRDEFDRGLIPAGNYAQKLGEILFLYQQLADLKDIKLPSIGVPYQGPSPSLPPGTGGPGGYDPGLQFGGP